MPASALLERPAHPVSGLDEEGVLRLVTPRVFYPLLKPVRFKGAKGGRGGAKSHFVAERLVADCLTGHQRVACLREYQSAIRDSSKKLIEDKIKQFGVRSLFSITDNEIRGPHESLFVFKGLHDYVSRPGGGPAGAIKSLEGFTRYWGEEAQSLSKRSLEILTPTARGRPGGTPVELWFTWNPYRKDDAVDVLFAENADDPDFACVHSTYMDNPWFEESKLRPDMERDRRRDPGKYAHIWLGEYLTRSEAQVFQNWRIEEFEAPADAPFRFGADWGFGDPTCLVRCYISGHQLYVDYEAHRVNCPIEAIPSLFLTVPGAKQHRIRGDSARPETIDYLKRRKFKITPSIKGPGSVEDGIEFLKCYDIVVHPRCVNMIRELSTYSYKIDPRTDDVLPKLADDNNHCLVAGTLVACERGDVPIECVTTKDWVLTRDGYRRVLFSGCTGIDREVLVVRTTGGEFTCTPDHEVWTSAGFVRADALRYSDEVDTLGESWQSGLSTLGGTTAGIGDTPWTTTLGRQLLELLIIFIATCGSFTRGLSRRATRSTTAMRTSRIARLTTWSAWLARITNYAIPTTPSVSLAGVNTSTGYDRLPSLGTVALSGWPSTERSARWPTPTSFLSPSPASSAERRSRLASSATRIASALTAASRRIVVVLEWMMNDELVKSVETSLPLTSMRERVPARGRVLTVSYGGVADRVYDLTIDDVHEFYANGVLVHNCIDSLRYALEDDRHRGKPPILPKEILQVVANTPTRSRFEASAARSGPLATIVTRNRFARAR